MADKEVADDAREEVGADAEEDTEDAAEVAAGSGFGVYNEEPTHQRNLHSWPRGVNEKVSLLLFYF